MSPWYKFMYTYQSVQLLITAQANHHREVGKPQPSSLNRKIRPARAEECIQHKPDRTRGTHKTAFVSTRARDGLQSTRTAQQS